VKTASVIKLPLTAYREVLALQRRLHGDVADGVLGDTWIVVEHPATVTIGRNGRRSNLLLPDDEFVRLGIDVVDVERGGDVTFHGPGQIVVYPILKLERFREVVPLVSSLERAVVDTLSEFGIVANGRREHRGVYVGDACICAVGIAVKRMVSLHGLALNVSTVLEYDRLITPCGVSEFGITSMERELGRGVSTGDVRDVLLGSIARAFDVELVELGGGSA
jgi:lipoyl(octanoyl) transferase